MEQWLLVCALATALRMAITAGLGAWFVALLVAQMLHALTFATHHTACIAMVTRHFPGRLRARQRKLRAPEMSGATFSISNLGMLDVTEFSAIINPPEGAILAVGSVRTVPVVTGDGLGVGRRMMLTLSCDHRVMDGAMGARLLQDVKHLLEEPLRLLV